MTVKEQILQYQKDKLRGSQIRSKAQILEEGEKPSKFFLRKELFRGKKKIIREIINMQGEHCTSTDTILGAFTDFYKNLFSGDETENDVVTDLLKDIPKITVQDAERLGLPVTLYEIKDALLNIWASLAFCILQSLNAG